MSYLPTVRANRMQSALTQDEVADLLKISQASMSALENTAETTSLETALGLQVIFEAPPHILFSKLYAKIEEAVMTRAAILEQKIRDNTDPDSKKKLHHLSLMMKRATSQNTAV